MAQLAIADVTTSPARSQGKIEDNEKLEEFLLALTDLSRKFNIAVGGDPELFIMEWEENGLTYHADSDSCLRLA